jgi:hypothetical protein
VGAANENCSKMAVAVNSPDCNNSTIFCLDSSPKAFAMSSIRIIITYLANLGISSLIMMPFCDFGHLDIMQKKSLDIFLRILMI